MTQLALVDDGRNSAYSVILYIQHNIMITVITIIGTNSVVFTYC